jgi:HEAT repeat protein
MSPDSSPTPLPGNPASMPFQKLLDALVDADNPLHPRFLYRLSDLEPDEVTRLAKVWSDVPLWRRRALLEDLEELSSSDTLMDFVAFCRQAIHDEDAIVRLGAIHTLWDYEEKSLIPLFLKMLEDDPDVQVRAAAATALGQYVYLGEIEELPEKTLRQIENRLLHVLQGEDAPTVRRCALEALGYSSREEVAPWIEQSYASSEKEWVASALLAMGRSGSQEWKGQVLAMLESKLPLVRCEAARAAGELEIARARPLLLELLDDPDDNIRAASIWSLSQIGGEGVRHVLEQIYEEAENDEDLSLLADALENLEFNEGLPLVPLLEIPELDEDEEEDDISEYVADVDRPGFDFDLDFDEVDDEFTGDEEFDNEDLEV